MIKTLKKYKSIFYLVILLAINYFMPSIMSIINSKLTNGFEFNLFLLIEILIMICSGFLIIMSIPAKIKIESINDKILIILIVLLSLISLSYIVLNFANIPLLKALYEHDEFVKISEIVLGCILTIKFLKIKEKKI